MPVMPGSIAKNRILDQLDMLCMDAAGRNRFQDALAANVNNANRRLHEWVEDLADADDIDLGPPALTTAYINHIADHWVPPQVVEDKHGEPVWDGPLTNEIFGEGLLEAIEKAITDNLPLNITWVCPDRTLIDPELLRIDSPAQITVLLVTPQRWWVVEDLGSAELIAEVNNELAIDNQKLKKKNKKNV